MQYIIHSDKIGIWKYCSFNFILFVRQVKINNKNEQRFGVVMMSLST